MTVSPLYLNGLPSPAPRRRRSTRKYLTGSIVSLAQENPGIPVILKGGKYVDKAYVPVLEQQAEKLGSMRVDWIFMEDVKNDATPSGKVSYAQMGQAFLTCVATPSAKKPASPKKKTKRKTAPLKFDD